MSQLSLISLVAAIAAWASYLPVAKSPRLRRTMWPTLAANGFAAALAIVAIAMKSESIQIAHSALGLCVLYMVLYFLVMRVPVAQGRPQLTERLPEIQLLNLNDEPATPRTLVPRGPILLVFYRGFW